MLIDNSATRCRPNTLFHELFTYITHINGIYTRNCAFEQDYFPNNTLTDLHRKLKP